jgi:uncharacterized membrane protein (TIGR02234 family)
VPEQSRRRASRDRHGVDAAGALSPPDRTVRPVTAAVAPRPRGPRSRPACALAGLAGAGLLVFLSGRTWVTRVLTDVPGVPRVSASGAGALPAVPALALVAGAAAVVLLVTGRVGRYLAAVLLLLAGLGAAVAVVSVLAAPGDAVATAVTAASGRSGGVAGPPATATAWVWAALAAAVLLVAAGLVAVLRARRWAAPGRRFESAGAGTAPGGTGSAPVPGEGNPIDAWDALSRGEDPTG